MTRERVRLFLSHAGERFAAGAIPEAELEVWLDQAIESAECAYPDVARSPEDFTVHLAKVMQRLPTPAAFRKLHTTDLYLAFACAGLDAHALLHFEKRYFPLADRAVGRLNLPGSVTGDVLAELREYLFVGRPDSPPRIGHYGGRGDLGAWVRSVVVNASFNAVRRDEKNTELEEADDVAAVGDPELAYLKNAYGAQLSSALRETLSKLPDDRRTLLRQRFLDGLSSEALARLHGVHRATVAKWIGEACDALLAGVRATLAQQLSVHESELDSIIRAGRTDLDVTLSRLLDTENRAS
jgi:RNA polymerase sigma-70 factor (ECF subfamily)